MKPGFDLGAYDTDKGPDYFAIYDSLFRPLADQRIKLLELGVLRGGSLLLWRDYFPRGTIVGLDAEPVDLVDPQGRIRIYRGRQEDTELLSRIAREAALEGFDIIIDDASHIAELTRISFWHLFDNHLRPGGLYAIEDWGTGYWDDWPDGRSYRPPGRLRSLWSDGLKRFFPARPVPIHSHNFGMVGFIKELIDELGAGDLTRTGAGRPARRESRFESMLMTEGLVVISGASTDRS